MVITVETGVVTAERTVESEKPAAAKPVAATGTATAPRLVYSHVMRRGETRKDVADIFGVSVEAITELNGLKAREMPAGPDKLTEKT